MKKLIILCVLFFSMNEASYSDFYGYDKCLSRDKISHQRGQHWQVTDPDWKISKEDVDSPLTKFSTETVVHRTVEPYHLNMSMLADITCSYQSDTLVLVRSYQLGKDPFPSANYIFADEHSHLNFLMWNSTTTCDTTLDALDKCHWGFYWIMNRC